MLELTKKSFAEELKKWRASRVQKEAAALLDVSVWTYRNWEWARTMPSPFAVIEIRRRMESTQDDKDH